MPPAAVPAPVLVLVLVLVLVRAWAPTPAAEATATDGRPAAPPPASTLTRISAPALPRHWLHGCQPDATGIVAVDASPDGRARLWRRLPGPNGARPLVVEEHAYPAWFLTTTLDPLAHLPVEHLDAAALRAAHGRLDPPPDGRLRIVHLEGGQDGPAFRYLVLARSLAEVEPALVDTFNKRFATTEPATSLNDLRGLVAVWPPAEQFLLLTGRAYHQRLAFEDVHRLQFDLETTGLDEHRDRIFMISLRDSLGWQACLDTGTMSEAALLEAFVRLVRERDPDVLENHNIFHFDLRFLARRAALLGVHLGLGRDGSAPVGVPDTLRLDPGGRTEPFLRWSIAGREVVDTLHAVKRHSARNPSLHQHGLKDAARHFGFAKVDREYVPGAEIWSTFQRDPERIRRYACDDVEEVDGLSRRLMGTPFALAALVPRRYESIATDVSPRGLLEPLLVRAYLHEGWALPVGRDGAEAGTAESPARLFVTGVVPRAVHLAVVNLAAWVVAREGLRPRPDAPGALPLLAETLLADPPDAEAARDLLAAAVLPYLARGGGLWSDPAVAAVVEARCRGIVDHLLAGLEAHGATLVEVDGERLLLGLPDGWDEAAEAALLAAAQALLPPDVRVRQEGRYRAVYARDERRRILYGYDGSVAAAIRGRRGYNRERFGEQFVREAAPYVLGGDVAGLRRLFLAAVERLRARQVPLADLAAQVTLYKSSAEYRRSTRSDERYEALLASGVREWRAGHRIRHYRDHSGARRVLREGDGASPAEADVEYYVRRLCSTYCQEFAQAFHPEDFARVFALPDERGETGDGLAHIQPIATRVAETGAAVSTPARSLSDRPPPPAPAR